MEGIHIAAYAMLYFCILILKMAWQEKGNCLCFTHSIVLQPLQCKYSHSSDNTQINNEVSFTITPGTGIFKQSQH